MTYPVFAFLHFFDKLVVDTLPLARQFNVVYPQYNTVAKKKLFFFSISQRLIQLDCLEHILDLII